MICIHLKMKNYFQNIFDNKKIIRDNEKIILNNEKINFDNKKIILNISKSKSCE